MFIIAFLCILTCLLHLGGAAEVNAATLTVTIGSGNGNGDPIPGEGAHTYNIGDEVPLIADPAPGTNFQWSGDGVSVYENNDQTITITGDMAITITYTLIEYTLTVNTAGAFGTGTVTKNPDQATYHYGDVVQLTAVPGTGETFASWSGDLSGSTNPDSVTINGNKSVTANFDYIEYTLTVNTAGAVFGDGTGTVTKNPDQATYHYGDVVQLTAVPGTGETFASWSGDLSGSTNPDSVTINGNKSVTATFDVT